MAGRRKPNDMLSQKMVQAQYKLKSLRGFQQKKATLLREYYAPSKVPVYIPRWQVEYVLTHTCEVLPAGATMESVAA